MKVSVVIPLYNKARHIRRAVDSVLRQSFGDLELIVVDDGSTDGSAAALRGLTDRRLRLIVQANAGECAARNRGIADAAAGRVAFLDADDEWRPDFLETVMGLHRRYPHAGAFATAYRCARGGTSWRPAFRSCGVPPEGGLLADYFLAGLGPSPVTSSSVMIPRRVFAEAGLFPAGVRTGGDSHMWARIALRRRIAWSPSECAVYHLSADNRVCDVNLVTRDMAAAAAVAEFLKTGWPAIVSLRSVDEYLAASRVPMALNCHLGGRSDWALELLAKTRGTRLFRWKRLALRGLIGVSPILLLKAMRIKAACRRLAAGRSAPMKGSA